MQQQSATILRELVQVVARKLYSPEHCVLLDALIRFQTLKDEDLSDYLKITLKDVNRIAAKLKNDRLIRSDAKPESRVGGKPLLRTFYILDYKLFVDVVKYKISMLRKRMNEDIQNDVTSKTYKCPSCEIIYSIMEASKIMFKCQDCGSMMVEVLNSVIPEVTQEMNAKFNEQFAEIIRLLKQTEDLTIEKLHVAKAIADAQQRSLSLKEKGRSITHHSNITDVSNRDVGHAFAPVDVRIETDDLALQQRTAEEQERKAQENKRPEWMEISTVSGIAFDGTRDEDTKSNIQNVQNINIEDHEIEKYKLSAGIKRKRDDEDPNDLVEHFDDEDDFFEEDSQRETNIESVMVSVQGQLVPLEDITEAHEEKMTPEEYSEYYKLFH